MINSQIERQVLRQKLLTVDILPGKSYLLSRPPGQRSLSPYVLP